MTLVKFCGITTTQDVLLAKKLGVQYIGLVFCIASPRYVSLIRGQHLALLARSLGLSVVALTVNADMAFYNAINAIIKPDLWQLHGSECEQTFTFIRNISTKPIIKAIAVASASDIPQYTTADYLLFDAKPDDKVLNKNSMTGGNGVVFDWSLIKKVNKNFFLAGGLTPQNVGDACRRVRPFAVDVSSGIESKRGIKYQNKMIVFMRGVV
jgi:phosphoribosylanthranilate isomerase